MAIIITITGLSTIPGVREQSSNSKDWINTLVSPTCSRAEVVDSPKSGRENDCLVSTPQDWNDQVKINCSIWELLIAAERQLGASCGFVLNTLNFFGYTRVFGVLRFGTRH
jgi:hypothetical protein